MVKSGLEFFILKFTEPLQRYLLTCQANSALLGRFFCTGQQQLWRGSVNFKINSRPLFTIIFKLENVNFKTRDFSPLIEWVLAGVMSFLQIFEPFWWFPLKQVFNFAWLITQDVKLGNGYQIVIVMKSLKMSRSRNLSLLTFISCTAAAEWAFFTIFWLFPG